MKKIWLAMCISALALLGACAGTDGKPGADGADGAVGADGTNGTVGAKGADGAKGATGANGTSPSAPDVSTAVTTELKNQLPHAVQSALDAAATGCDAVKMDPADYDGIYQVQKHLEPGVETEVCAIYKTGPTELWMNSSDQVLAAGSHHGLLWLTDLTKLPKVDSAGEPVEIGKIVPCEGIAAARFTVPVGGQTWPIVGSQGGGNGISRKGLLPSDVAIKIPANSYVVADIHMLNATDKPIEVCMKVGLHGIPASQVKHEAGPFFFYNPMITVPANGTSVARQACKITQNVTLATAVSHMHARGVGYEATLLSGSPYDSTTTVKKTLYKGTEWEAPVDTIFSTPLQLTAGDWIDYHCNYTNPENRIVANNTQTVDEMCMFLGMFWPYDRDLSFCAAPDKGVGNSAGLNIGDGTKNGADFLGCFWNNVNRPGATDFTSGGLNMSTAEYQALYDFQGCFTTACEPVGEFSRPYATCVGDNSSSCQTDCKAAQANFQAQCAVTAMANGGCKEKYGTNGSDGTCATDSAVKTAAVTTCTTAERKNIIDGICNDLCTNGGASCTDPTAAACTACKGTIDFQQSNTGCLNQQTLVCVGDEIKKSATACVQGCFTSCITAEVTSCVVNDCVNGEKCKGLYDSLVAATCP